MIVRRTTAGLLIALAASGALVGCKGKTSVAGTTIVTVTATEPSPTSSGATAGGSGAPSASVTTTGSSGSAGPVPTGMTTLAGRCETRLAAAAVADALGRAIPGKTAFVVGVADKTTGRVSNINCRYGIARNPDNPALEIGVSLYRTAGQADARIPLTITDFQDNSAMATKTTVAGRPATLLLGGQSAGYGPSLVMAYGQRTIAVTFRAGTVTAADAPRQLTAVAALAIRRTGPA